MSIKKLLEALVWMLVAIYAMWSAIHHLRAGEDAWAAFMVFTAVLAFMNLQECR